MKRKTDPFQPLVNLREERGLTQEALAKQLGMKSKGHLCDVENSGRASPRIALAIEKWSDRKIDAALLSQTIAEARGIAS